MRLTNQKIAIAIIKCCILHRRIAKIHVNGKTVSVACIASTANCVQTLHKALRLGGLDNFEWQPSQLIRIRWLLIPVVRKKWTAIGVWHERFVLHGRPNAVEPRALILSARSGKRCARQLLGIQTVRTFLRWILILRQCVWIFRMFGRKVRTESGEILWRKWRNNDLAIILRRWYVIFTV